MTGGRHRLDEGDTLRRRLRNLPVVRPFTRACSVVATRAKRVDAWLSTQGRGNLALAAMGGFFVVIGISSVASDRVLFNSLTTRGMTTDATVTEVFSRGHGNRGAEVRFSVRGRPVSEDLVYTAPHDIREEQRIQVVYDRQDTSQVVLISQLNRDHIVAGYVLTALGAAATVIGLGRWWIVRRRSDQPRPDRWTGATTGRHARNSTST